MKNTFIIHTYLVAKTFSAHTMNIVKNKNEH